MRAAVIGNDARTAAVRQALLRSPRVSGDVPYLSDGKHLADPRAWDALLQSARTHRPDFVFVGPEDPLARGVVNQLQSKCGIPCIGPTAELAKLESSKAFTRELLRDHGIPGNPEHRIFRGLDGMEDYLRRLDGFVIKPDGLTGGKGVKVSGEHLPSATDALAYARELFHGGHRAVIVEEKLDGEEFSLQSFCDGTHVVHMPLVQDHKRAFEGDIGPNTGGMGSYSCADHRLPFVDEATVKAAGDINTVVVQALWRQLGEKYRGILYGGFMLTRDGVRLIEFNARFGDPEALNVLSLLETDFAELCVAMLEERLDEIAVRFRPLATVCKYVVPTGYPDHPVTGMRIDMSHVPPESAMLRRYVAALESRSDGWYLTGSRAVAFVGLGQTTDEAETVAEAAACAVAGPVYHRSDIGTRTLIQRRIEHVRLLVRP